MGLKEHRRHRVIPKEDLDANRTLTPGELEAAKAAAQRKKKQRKDAERQAALSRRND